MESIWKKTEQRITFNSLSGNKNTDVLIVGGGIAGILCAYRLKNAGVDCILVEGDKICGGVTEFTTAKITMGHGLIYDSLIKKYGEETAKKYLEAQVHAGEQYATLCKTMDCDYEQKDSYVYSLKSRQTIEKEISALKRLGIDAEFSVAEHLPFQVKGAVRVKNQAQFHPLKFLYRLAKDLPIFEGTKVMEYTPETAVTNRGIINYKRLIIATHFPIYNKHGSYFLKLYQHRSYVLALKNAPTVKGMYVDESDVGLSFRNYGELLLLGGGGHRTGKSGGCWEELERFAKNFYKNTEIVGKWATQDCITLDGIPYVGQYSKNTPNVYVATGFNKWGMTNAMAGAEILCDMIQGKPNPYATVFSPSRKILHPQLAVNAWESAVGLLTPTTPRCPHLGCALKYNRAEHSWDCPCHGSRFTETGYCINNPATGDLKRKIPHEDS